MHPKIFNVVIIFVVTLLAILVFPKSVYALTGFVDPNGDGATLEWGVSPVGSSHYTAIDDGIRQPDTAVDSELILSRVGIPRTDEFHMTTIPGVTRVSQIKVWAYGKVGRVGLGEQEAHVFGNIYVGGAWQVEQDFGFNSSSSSWKSVTFSGNWTQADLDALQVRLKKGPGDEDTITAIIQAMYAEITDPNVYGWAWSENIGWISFNCNNYYDNNNPSALSNRCSGSNYGTDITIKEGQSIRGGDLGIFSGYAWSDNIGWISFNLSETGDPPAPPYQTGTPHLAQVDFPISPPVRPAPPGGWVSGWARALSAQADPTGGWDGWIKLGGDIGNRKNWEVRIETNVQPLEFKGWAWGSDVVGWVSFNCQNEGSCGTSKYKVLLNLALSQSPTASELTLTENYCGISAGRGLISLGWAYNDPDNEAQSQYHLQISTNAGFSSTVVNCIVNQPLASGQRGSSAVSVLFSPGNICNDGGELGGRSLQVSYGTNFFWRLKVKDAGENWSVNWINGPNFRTPSHPYPWIDFTWSPQFPGVNEVVQFADQSTCYPGPTTCNSWFWTFPSDWEFEIKDPGPPPIYYNNTDQNPLGKFKTLGQKDVTLRATDGDGFACERIKQLNSRLPLPHWKEIAPF